VPVVIEMLIRADLAPWPGAGHWIGDQLEALGFTVNRTVRTGATASPIWIGTHPREGKMHMYTGGWISPAIPRNQGGIFDQMYTHRVMAGFGLWDVLEEQLEEFPDLDNASRKLRFNEFKNMAERKVLFDTVLWEAMKFSNCIWVADVAGTNPYRTDIRVASNVAGGIGDPNWVHTLHKFNTTTGEAIVGGDITVEFPNLFNEPWNPVAGSSWSYDMFPTRRALGDAATMSDPGTGPDPATGGLPWPQRIASATVWTDEDLPVGQTIDWDENLEWNEVAATFAGLQAPEDAWADWDATTQTFIDAGTRFADPADRFAATRVRVVYDDNLWDLPLHDGTTMSPADFLMGMIYTFDRGKPDSPVFEPTAKAAIEAWLDNLKGFQIVSLDPLTIDTWHDTWYLDAEIIADARTWWPLYGTYGWTGFWHKIAAGWVCESPDHGGGITGAWTSTKAEDNDVPYLDYTKGPSLPVLDSAVAWATTNDFIPYYDAIKAVYDDEALGYEGDDLDAEIAARWAAIAGFRTDSKHYWVGNGPFMIANALDDLDPPTSIILTRFADYPDDATKWFGFMPDAEYTGPERMGVFPDRVILAVETSHATAISKLKAGTIDVYAFGITDPILVSDIQANLSYDLNFGSYRDVRFNTYRDPETKEPFFAEDFGGKLNPFAIPEIREAMNYLLDRPLIVAQHLVGAGAPKWTALGTVFPDHALYYDDIVEPIEEEYSRDFAKAKAIIDAQMEALGATLPDPESPSGVGNKWQYDYGDFV